MVLYALMASVIYSCPHADILHCCILFVLCAISAGILVYQLNSGPTKSWSMTFKIDIFRGWSVCHYLIQVGALVISITVVVPSP